jgi:hypothetical protein
MAISLLLLLAGCSTGTSADTPAAIQPASTAEGESAEAANAGSRQEGQASFVLNSDAFGDEEAIPERYSCDGENISPPLEWREPPPGTASFALIFDDPDAVAVAGVTWVHWILFNLPGTTRTLPEALLPDELPGDTLPGLNSWDRQDYGGPCPPRGTHRYFFKLYALDEVLDLEAGATSEELRLGMEGHLLGETTLVGSYTR